MRANEALVLFKTFEDLRKGVELLEGVSAWHSSPSIFSFYFRGARYAVSTGQDGISIAHRGAELLTHKEPAVIYLFITELKPYRDE